MDWSTTIVVMAAFDSWQLASLRSLTEVFGPMCLILGNVIPDVLDKQKALFRRNLNHFASLRSYAQLPLNRPALAFLRLVNRPIGLSSVSQG